MKTSLGCFDELGVFEVDSSLMRLMAVAAGVGPQPSQQSSNPGCLNIICEPNLTCIDGVCGGVDFSCPTNPGC